MRRLAILLAFVVGACSQAPATEPVRDRLTIVSLNPCSDAVLAEVAAPGQLLAISHYSHDPASSSMDLATARRFRAVSGSVEEVLSHSPDVVVAGAFLPPATRAALDRLGIEVVTVPISRSIAESREQVMQLARLAGDETRGKDLNARIDGALVQAEARKGEAPVPAIVWQAGGIVPGPDTLVADLLSRTGFANAAAAKGMRQADYLPLETMLADPPRVILAAGNARSAENRLLSHPALSALKHTRVEPFDPSLLWCGGPTIVAAAERLAAVRRAFETPLQPAASAAPQDERKAKLTVRPEERGRMSERLEGPAS